MLNLWYATRLVAVRKVDDAGPVVGDPLHDGHPEGLLPAEQRPVDPEQERGHEYLRVPKGLAKGQVEGRGHYRVRVHEQEEVTFRHPRPGVESRSTPAHRGRRAVFLSCSCFGDVRGNGVRVGRGGVQVSIQNGARSRETRHIRGSNFHE